MNQEKNNQTFKEKIFLVGNEIESKFLNNSEGLYSNLDSIKANSTKCCMCNAVLGIIKSGVSQKGFRFFLTTDDEMKSYFVCRNCIDSYYSINK